MFVSRVPIRWGDMDAMGHVNNTIYFRYVEQARCEWLDHMNVVVSNQIPYAPVLISAHCEFLLPLTAPGVAVVELSLGKAGRSSIETFFTITKEGPDSHDADGQLKLYARGGAKMVWINTQTGKSSQLPDTIRQLATVK